MSRRVLRYAVPVDDRWHEIELHGEVLHVDARTVNTVELWALDGGLPTRRKYRVYGTGQPLDGDATAHVGSVIVAGGALVWHLFSGAPDSGEGETNG